MIEYAWKQIFHSCKIFTYLCLIKSAILRKLPFKFVVIKQKLHRLPFHWSQRANNFAAFGAICFKLSDTNSCHGQLNHTFRAKYSFSYWIVKMQSKYSVSKLCHLLDFIFETQKTDIDLLRYNYIITDYTILIFRTAIHNWSGKFSQAQDNLMFTGFGLHQS